MRYEIKNIIVSKRQIEEENPEVDLPDGAIPIAIKGEGYPVVTCLVPVEPTPRTDY